MLYESRDIEDGKIIMCPRCEGAGRRPYSHFEPAMNGWMPGPVEECRMCRGRRVVELRLLPIKE